MREREREREMIPTPASDPIWSGRIRMWPQMTKNFHVL